MFAEFRFFFSHFSQGAPEEAGVRSCPYAAVGTLCLKTQFTLQEKNTIESEPQDPSALQMQAALGVTIVITVGGFRCDHVNPRDLC